MFVLAEHYVWEEGDEQETYSYYGWLNALAYNVGYHKSVGLPHLHSTPPPRLDSALTVILPIRSSASTTTSPTSPGPVSPPSSSSRQNFTLMVSLLLLPFPPPCLFCVLNLLPSPLSDLGQTSSNPTPHGRTSPTGSSPIPRSGCSPGSEGKTRGTSSFPTLPLLQTPLTSRRRESWARSLRSG